MRLLRYASVAFAATLLAPTLASADPDDELTISGESYSGDPFNGFGDSGQVINPDPPWPFDPGDVYYMLYSYLFEGVTTPYGESPIDDTYVVQTHFAYSANGGNSWTKASLPGYGALWPSLPYTDVVSGDVGRLNHETPTLAVHIDPTYGKRWFGSRITYYQNAESGFHPDYTGGWFIEISAAYGADPGVLRYDLLSADETTRIAVDSVAQSANEWIGEGDTNLADVDPVLGYHCFLNNPAIYYSESAGRLVLVAECTIFANEERNWDDSGIIVLSTSAEGDPVEWDWEFEGVLANKGTSDELVAGTGLESYALGLTQPFIAKGSESGEVVLMTISVEDEGHPDGFSGWGCVALKLDTLFPGIPEYDPPYGEEPNPDGNGRYLIADMLARYEGGPNDGELINTAWVDADGNGGAGSCNYATGSTTGIVYNLVDGGDFRLHRSEVAVP